MTLTGPRKSVPSIRGFGMNEQIKDKKMVKNETQNLGLYLKEARGNAV